MDLDTFQDLLDAHGADLAAWPTDDRRQAEALLGHSAAARAALEEASGLDARLARSLASERAGEALRARILAVPADHPRRDTAKKRSWPALFTRPWRIGTAAATTALLFGIYAGASGVPIFEDAYLDQPAGEAIDVAALAFGSESGEDILPGEILP